MGRGRGGYTEAQPFYRDSGGAKVTDRGAIFVAERYIDLGYEVVFRREHQDEKSYDLTVKTSDDQDFVKNIEVKRVTSNNPSKFATNIQHAFEQVPSDGTAVIILPNYTSTSTQGLSLMRDGFAEASRKGWIPESCHVEVWFKDGKCIMLK